VVEDVGKRSLYTQLDPRGDHDVLAETTGEVGRASPKPLTPRRVPK
jgi:hypothetical protein